MRYEVILTQTTISQFMSGEEYEDESSIIFEFEQYSDVVRFLSLATKNSDNITAKIKFHKEKE